MAWVIYLVNFLGAFFIFKFEAAWDDERSVVVATGIYLLLIVANIIVGAISRYYKKSYGIHYYYAAGILFITPFILAIVWIADF